MARAWMQSAGAQASPRARAGATLGSAAVRRAVGLMALAAIGVAGWVRFGPLPADLLQGVDTPSAVFVDRHDRVLYEALGSDGDRTRPLTAATVPAVLAAATIAAEDRRFYSHAGVDPVSLLRAARHNLAEGRVVEGGSTITQQVAKLLIQRRDGIARRGVREKLREMVLALRLEHRFSKREILALYLTVASYGNQTTGAARASQAYFGVDPSMLTAAQAAFIAALPQRPSAFNPWRNAASARTRQQAVLRRMAVAGFLTPDEARGAREERLTLQTRRTPFGARHFVEMVWGSLAGGHGRPPAGRIRTTLDLDLQREIEGIIEHERPSLKAHGAANVAVVVLDNRTGGWLAWEGSGAYADADHGGAINGPTVPRQPGSALKPFTYALAFEEGRTPATVLADVPSHFPTSQPGVLYVPRNYDSQYRGPLLIRRALAGSENVPAVALASDLGVSALLRFLDRAGLSAFDRTPSYYGLGLTLGDAEVRLDELVAAYAMLARGGVWTKPRALMDSSDPDPALDERRVAGERTAFWITDILSDSDARSYIFGRGGSLEFPFPVAVKTGTSQAYHDNWTIGYTRAVTVGVWVGNFDRTPLRNSSGITGAGPIFHAAMLAAEARVGGGAPVIVPPPAGLEQVTICALSGRRAAAACPTRAREWLPEGAAPLPCDWHRATAEGVITTYPPEFREWAASAAPASAVAVSSPARRGWPDTPPVAASMSAEGPPAAASEARASARSRDGSGRPDGSGRRDGVGPARVFSIASPPAGAIYSVDPTLRREFQAVPLRAVASRPTSITWLVDGTPFATASSEQSVGWPLVVGTHAIEARGGDGRRARASVIVR